MPKEFMIVPPGPHYERVLKTGFIAPGNTAVGIAALGVAQASYELGRAYAAERTQGGKPIAEHQLVAKRIFDAYGAIEASRLMLYRAATTIAAGTPDMAAIYAARVQACRTAAGVTADMMFLHGGNGITTEYPVEKLWRDAQPLQLADGTVDIVTLQGARHLGEAQA
ncbi:MAG: acyl-CoA dehydrogenase [Acidimicrobiia bacterium]